jgi:glucosamine--fructose-6-phosphate aminotransferase (isomerizing)
MVEPSFPAFLFTPSGVTWPGMREMIEKLAQLKAETLIVTDRSNTDALGISKRAICIPASLDDMYTPIPYIIPAQILAAQLAEQKGLNPDEPRTLSKVTRTL